MQQPDDSEILAVQTGKLSHLLIGDSPRSLQKVCVLSGSFDPLHEGHVKMAEIAAARTGRELVYELCLKNVDKPPLTVEKAKQRIGQSFSPHSLALTGAPTFVEKSTIFHDAMFAVGADTIERIADPAYYDNDVAKRNQAINLIREAGCRFLVFGRAMDRWKRERDQAASNRTDHFRSLSELSLPKILSSLCEEVSRTEFDCSASSTEIRNRQISPEAE